MKKNRGPEPGDPQPISAAQSRLLSVLEPFENPVTLAELADHTGLHENTLRGHLAALCERGYVTRLPVAAVGRGRPAWSYLRRESTYPALVEALATGMETPAGQGVPAAPQDAAVRGGRVWGARLRRQLGNGSDERALLMRALAHVGFAPSETGSDGVIRLTRCPMLDAARGHQDIVCGVHQGLIEGVLGRHIDPHALRPFAQPGACLVMLE